MKFFKSKDEKVLDGIIESINMNMANNYKDAAQGDLKELEEIFSVIKESGSLKENELSEYEAKINYYRERLKGYSHKDQKPYWSKS